jgi:hypothetical protein
MTSCLVTRNAAIITFDNGKRLELPRREQEPPVALLSKIQSLVVLDQVRFDLSVR